MQLFKIAGLRPGTSPSVSIYAEQLSAAEQTRRQDSARYSSQICCALHIVVPDMTWLVKTFLFHSRSELSATKQVLSPLALVHKNCLDKIRINRAERRCAVPLFSCCNFRFCALARASE